MKLSAAEADQNLPVVELVERRILLSDGRYLIYFDGSIMPASLITSFSPDEEEEGNVRAQV